MFQRPQPLRLIAAFAVIFGLMCTAAQAKGMRVLRDAETEQFLRDLSAPVLRAGGMDPQSVNFVILDAPEINAFVAGGQNIFINSGLILKTKTPLQLLGVIAHESGHIAGGHLVRSERAMNNASSEAIIATLAGILAGIASGHAEVAGGGLAGGQSVGQRSYFSFSRTQEGSADASGVRFLHDAGYSATGMVEFMQIIGDEELLPASQQDPYARTHPLTRDRVSYLADEVAHEGSRKPLSPALEFAYARVQAKLLGYQRPAVALQRYKETSTDEAELIGRAWALYADKRMDEAVTLADRLLAKTPDDPWLLELKGQALLDSGHVAEAVAPYAKAAKLVPNSSQLQLGLGRAILASGSQSELPAAIAALKTADRLEPNDPTVAQYLSEAYGKQGNEVSARLYAAQMSFLNRDKPIARAHAEWVVAKAPPGSRDALKAQDILDQLTKEK